MIRRIRREDCEGLPASEGLFSSLLLVMGLVTSQARLLVPWLLHHAGLCCLCVAGGVYQVDIQPRRYV